MLQICAVLLGWLGITLVLYVILSTCLPSFTITIVIKKNEVLLIFSLSHCAQPVLLCLAFKMDCADMGCMKREEFFRGCEATGYVLK